MKELCVIILNYRRAELTITCLESIEQQITDDPDRCVVVVDNASDDGSADAIGKAIEERNWKSWCTLIKNEINAGFAAGNNLGFQSVNAKTYLLLNSDTQLLPGAIDRLLKTANKRPEVGMIGPRLQGPDGEPQISCFRYRSPINEFLNAASTSVIDRILHFCDIAIPLTDKASEPSWLSFACILIRREVVDQIGPMDDEYFMYFEDIDYCRRARKAGWIILNDPEAKAIHHRGGSSSVKTALAKRDRVPRYYYESRSRYFAKFYGGRMGVLITNLCWLLGRCVSVIREIAGTKQPHICDNEASDNWINWQQPMRRCSLPTGGEL